jgi:DNA-binding PadR family transcriptional regulator
MSDPSILVLSSLADGDKHGYAMMDDIERFAGVRLGPGTLYGAITRLEERGWIAPVKSKSDSNSKDRRQPYTITSSGREHLRDQLANMGRIVRAGQRRLENA